MKAIVPGARKSRDFPWRGRSGGRGRGEPQPQPGGRGRREPGAGAEPPPPRTGAARPSDLKWSPGLMSAREAGRGQPHRGGGEGKVSRRAGRPAAYLPPREPLFASPLPRGFCQTGAAALAPSPPPPPKRPSTATQGPARPGLAPAPARRAGAGALQRRAPRSRRRRRHLPRARRPGRRSARGISAGAAGSAPLAGGPRKGCAGANGERRGRGKKPTKPNHQTTTTPKKPQANPTATQALASTPAERQGREIFAGRQVPPPRADTPGPRAGAGGEHCSSPFARRAEGGGNGDGPRSARSGAPRQGPGPPR